MRATIQVIAFIALNLMASAAYASLADLQTSTEQYEISVPDGADIDFAIDEELYGSRPFFYQSRRGCYRHTCSVFAYISKAEQKMYLFVEGKLAFVWLISTGSEKYPTPNFDKHPNGRVYDKYSSTKYPEGDYGELGNMPYSVFIAGDYAVHGTPSYNWATLGQAKSHGCVRMHPKHGFYFNRLVRKYGVRDTWITVE